MTLYDEVPTGYYDLFWHGVEGELPFYVEEARRAGSPVLELGCGTGRILIPTAEAGIEIVGLDISPFMLDSLRRKMEKLDPAVVDRITLVEGDMCDFSLGKQFRLVTIPYRAFLHVMTAEDQRRSLSCIRDHLVEGGRLIVNFFDPRLDLVSSGTGETRPPLKLQRGVDDPETGHHIAFYDSALYDPAKQWIEHQTIFEESDADGKVVRRSEDVTHFRWIYRYEMEHLLIRCGFEVEALYGDFNRGPFRYGGEMIWVAGKAGGGSR